MNGEWIHFRVNNPSIFFIPFSIEARKEINLRSMFPFRVRPILEGLLR